MLKVKEVVFRKKKKGRRSLNIRIVSICLVHIIGVFQVKNYCILDMMRLMHKSVARVFQCLVCSITKYEVSWG